MSETPRIPQPPTYRGPAAARLVVCERSGRWAAALRRELTGAVRVCETRTLADCWTMLTKAPASFVVVELTSGGETALLQAMGHLDRDFPLARLAVVADRSRADTSWALREAGAVHFVCSPRQLGPLAGLAWRHLAAAPLRPRDLAEQIWAGLPWGRDDMP